MTRSITPFLMFTGQAEEAMNLYVSLFGDSKIDKIDLYTSEGPGAEGTVKEASFILCGREFACADSPSDHASFPFSPAMSLFVDVADEAEIDRAFAGLSEGGKIIMPLNTYPFAKKFAWLTDRFGLTWQLMLPA
jgi:predicted 3-demethylubiquinone-9 3-methyltransferase (glyoxalase superfamily)